MSSSPTLKGFVPLDTNALYDLLGKTVEEIEAVDNKIPHAELFPEINVGSTSTPVEAVNASKLGKDEAMMNEGNQEDDVGEFADTNSNNGGLQKDIFWDKDITKARKKGNQVMHFPAEVIKKALRPDITSCTMMDLETAEYYDCKIIKSNREYVEMYLAEGWYSFAKNKKLNVGDKLIFHYNSEKEILHVKVFRKDGKKQN
ncbi:uncharacterized protein LOC131624812 [Vicia villosa]|uniref:uncharacterized protein LOC131624812 n=1 Tax=Vicia villosa TaxID=3911 RepID=UPI00273AAEC2|nr:uncharacterized protein LOC131624812 [Vicia villosa]